MQNNIEGQQPHAQGESVDGARKPDAEELRFEDEVPRLARWQILAMGKAHLTQQTFMKTVLQITPEEWTLPRLKENIDLQKFTEN